MRVRGARDSGVVVTVPSREELREDLRALLARRFGRDPTEAEIDEWGDRWDALLRPMIRDLLRSRRG